MTADLPEGIDIRCCDCLGPQGLPSLADGSVDLTVTSPPYNQLGSRIPTKPSGMRKRHHSWEKKVNQMGYGDDMPEEQYVEWQIAIADEIYRVTKPNGSYFYNHKLRYRDKEILHPLDIVRQFKGWKLRQEIIWDRGGAIAHNARMFPPCDERIYWLVKNDGDHVWNEDANAFLSIWKITPERGVDGHPCPFPIAIPKRCIAAVTVKENVVVDPFLGSGTTAEACYQLGRRFIGFDLNPAYVDIAKSRLRQQRLVL